VKSIGRRQCHLLGSQSRLGGGDGLRQAWEVESIEQRQMRWHFLGMGCGVD